MTYRVHLDNPWKESKVTLCGRPTGPDFNPAVSELDWEETMPRDRCRACARSLRKVEAEQERGVN